MSAPVARHVQVGEHPCRVLEKGDGEAVGFLGGLHGLPNWTPFLDRLAETRRVIAPSLPGFPGALGHEKLDDVADWVTATLDLIDASGLDGADLVGASVGGALAAEVAALSRSSVRRLVLIAPFGLFDAEAPVADVFATRPSELPALLSASPARLAAFLARPDGEDEVEWQIVAARGREAAARLLWPTGDLGLAKRLHRIQARTLIVWGAEDRVIPPRYARRFASGVSAMSEIREIAGAGHVAEIDSPDAVAEAVLRFLD